MILLIEDFPCETENQATSREAYYILNHDCVNKRVPGRTKEEGDKVYYENNREEILIQKKEYDDFHKDQKEISRIT